MQKVAKKSAYSLNMDRQEFREEYCEMLVEHMAEGYSFTTFGAIVGISSAVLGSWVKDVDIFKEAREIGKLCQLKKWEELLIMNANGTASGGSSALKFAMINYFPEEFKEKSTVEHDGNVVFQIESGIDYDKAKNLEYVEGEFREIGVSKELPTPMDKEDAL